MPIRMKHLAAKIRYLTFACTILQYEQAHWGPQGHIKTKNLNGNCQLCPQGILVTVVLWGVRNSQIKKTWWSLTQSLLHRYLHIVGQTEGQMESQWKKKSICRHMNMTAMFLGNTSSSYSWPYIIHNVLLALMLHAQSSPSRTCIQFLNTVLLYGSW